MTTALAEKTMTVEEISSLKSNDLRCLMSVDSTIAESGKHLESYYQNNSRSIEPGVSGPSVYGGFWTKVSQVADILKGSDEWPFPPLTVRGDHLFDGHHRANAAIKAGWSKPIPVTEEWVCWS